MTDLSKQPTRPGGVLPPEYESIPEKIGEYKIESLLERGGMSYVFLGTHPETSDPVTVKTLNPNLLQDPEAVQRFLNEAELIRLNDHPNIIKLYSQGEWEKGYFIAMEFIQGASLRHYIQHNPLSLRRALKMILEIAYALCHLHTNGIIHRDLKLENILLTEDQHIKVIDFGIAQLLEHQQKDRLIETKQLIGTPIYMSPEQRQAPESVSYPSDIYSLGIIAYELVLGKLSHGKIHLSLMPKGLQSILAKCLRPHPKDRYSDIVDFIAAISDYLDSVESENEERLASQLSEAYLEAKAKLVHPDIPKWEGIEMAIAEETPPLESGWNIRFSEPHRILIKASKEKGVSGVFDLLKREETAGFFGHFELQIFEETLSYNTHGHGTFWFFHDGWKELKGKGSQVITPGDRCIFWSGQLDQTFLETTLALSAQKWADQVLRKASRSSEKYASVWVAIISSI